LRQFITLLASHTKCCGIISKISYTNHHHFLYQQCNFSL